MTSLAANKSIFLLGAGGQARAVYGLLQSCGYTITGFFDDQFIPDEKIGNASAIGRVSAITEDHVLVLAMGGNHHREKYFQQFQKNILIENCIHSSAVVFNESKIGKSNLIFAGVIVNSFAVIGDNNILNTACIIEHEVKLGSHNHISIRAILAGRVSIGNRCFIGAGAIIKDAVSIVDDCIIGAGAVVVNDITEAGTYVGIPAKRIK